MLREYIFLIEHPKRELEFIKRICFELRSKGQLTYIYSIHFDLWKINQHKEAIIFLPYCLSEDDYPFSAISKRKRHLFVNMNWEQILSPINKSVKIITGEARNNLQFSWNLDFRDHLSKTCQVNEKRIIKSINPTALLFKTFKGSDLFEKYLSELDISNYIFLPLNYNWALMDEKRRAKRIKNLGYNKNSALSYIHYSEKHLIKTFDFISKLLTEESYTVIIRPHPGISIQAYKEKICKTGFGFLLRNKKLIINNSFSAIEWIHYSKYTISNWSTLIFDSWYAGYPSCYYWPEKIPSFIDAYHTQGPPKIQKVKDLINLKTNDKQNIETEFSVFIDTLIELQYEQPIKRNFNFSFKAKAKLIRSFIRYLMIKLNLESLIDSIVMIDYFDEPKVE